MVFLGCQANARWSVHSPRDHYIITHIISDWGCWLDTRDKWHLARNPVMSWWHRHTSLNFFGRCPWLYGQQVLHHETPSFSFLLPPWRTVWSYQLRLQVGNPIWGGRTAFGLVAGVFLNHKVNARRYMHTPQFHLIIILIVNWQMWLTWHLG